jgi:hypothetical protein
VLKVSGTERESRISPSSFMDFKKVSKGHPLENAISHGKDFTTSCLKNSPQLKHVSEFRHMEKSGAFSTKA